MSTCDTPLSWEDLVAYWADDLDDAAVARVDEHLIGCEACTGESARASGVITALRNVIPMFVDHARLAALRAQGHVVRENPILPGQRKPAIFPADADLLIHRLMGLDLANAEAVAITLSVEEDGHVMVVEPSVPFDRDSGEVLIACQRHFESFPPNVIAEVVTRDASGAERRASYPIPHVFEARPAP